jgi:tetratricopeptide (TPR) repeat protein
VRLLVDESRRRVHAEPAESYHVAELARFVTHSAPRIPDVFDLTALATAEMANAARASGQLRQAEEHFGHARYLITHQGVTDPEILARIDELEGSLRKDQRRFPAAERLLARAAMLYRLSGAKAEIARVLLNLGYLYFDRGEVGRALETTRSALEKVVQADEPRLYLCARFNLARYLTEAGEYHRAASLLAEDEGLYREFPEAWTQLRLIWLRGKIAAGLGKSQEAEQAFLTARAGFVAQGIGYDAAMVAVEDLAPLYLHEHRTEDVKRLAEEMLPIFQSQDVHREALTALVMFQEAARREELTVTMVRDLAAYLKAARTDPSLRFKEPS